MDTIYYFEFKSLQPVVFTFCCCPAVRFRICNIINFNILFITTYFDSWILQNKQLQLISSDKNKVKDRIHPIYLFDWWYCLCVEYYTNYKSKITHIYIIFKKCQCIQNYCSDKYEQPYVHKKPFNINLLNDLRYLKV